MTQRLVALTTFDNPFDPFEDFVEWYKYDEDRGYHSCSILARFARTSDSLSDAENNSEIERAIDQIIKYDYENKYKKLVKVDTEVS